MGWRYIGDYFISFEIQYRHDTPLSNLVSGILINIKHVKITWSETIRVYSKFENLKFYTHIFNKNIFFNISLICLKFSTHVDKGHLEGSVSQNLDLGPTFYFMQSPKK